MSSDNQSASTNERLGRPTLRALFPQPPLVKAISQSSATSQQPNKLQRKSTNIPPLRKISHGLSYNQHHRFSHDFARVDPSDHGKRSRTSSTLVPRPVKYENTYKMVPDKQFSASEVEKIIQSVFDEYLSNMKYNGDTMGQTARRLSDIIRERVKVHKFDRFKIISWVSICEKKNNNMKVASRGLWDASTDGFASYSFENSTLYAIGNVYAVYHE